MDTEVFYKSGIINDYENIILYQNAIFEGLKGILVLTDYRLYFLYKEGIFSKGYHIDASVGILNIDNVSIKGLINKSLSIQMKNMNIWNFQCFNSELFHEVIIKNKDVEYDIKKMGYEYKRNREHENLMKDYKAHRKRFKF